MQQDTISTVQIDQSLVGSSEFLVDVQMEALENAGYKISKALDSKVDRNRIEAFDLVENYKKGMASDFCYYLKKNIIIDPHLIMYI